MKDIPGRILLADSNPLLLNMQRGYFLHHRINVASAQSAEEALRMLRALRPQVAILSYDLSGDGALCCQQIKADTSLYNLPVLLLAPNNQDAIDRCWESGCDGVLVRPVNRRELAHVTQSFINLSQRASPRINTKVLVRFGFNGEMSHHDYSVNLSSGGLYLASEEQIELGQEIRLEFMLPGTTQTLQCHGRIAWINQGPQRKRQDLADGLGIEFISLTPEKRRRLQQFVMKFLRGQHS